jgi:hypothetical protein
MNPQFTAALVLSGIAMLILSCTDTTTMDEKQATTTEKASSTTSIEGTWELVWEDVGGKVRDNGKSSQFKMFHDGFFSLIAFDSTGKWSWAGAGTYSLDGNIYKETFKYSSVPEYIGANDWQEYELKGDTLITKGFTKVVFADGKDKTSDYPKFVEKRVRAKR